MQETVPDPEAYPQDADYLYLCLEKDALAPHCLEDQAGAGGYIQSLKKLSQCLAIFQRLSCRQSNKLHNNLEIIHIILDYLGFRISPMSCDLV